MGSLMHRDFSATKRSLDKRKPERQPVTTSRKSTTQKTSFKEVGSTASPPEGLSEKDFAATKRNLLPKKP